MYAQSLRHNLQFLDQFCPLHMTLSTELPQQHPSFAVRALVKRLVSWQVCMQAQQLPQELGGKLN